MSARPPSIVPMKPHCRKCGTPVEPLHRCPKCGRRKWLFFRPPWIH